MTHPSSTHTVYTKMEASSFVLRLRLFQSILLEAYTYRVFPSMSLIYWVGVQADIF